MLEFPTAIAKKYCPKLIAPDAAADNCTIASDGLESLLHREIDVGAYIREECLFRNYPSRKLEYQKVKRVTSATLPR